MTRLAMIAAIVIAAPAIAHADDDDDRAAVTASAPSDADGFAVEADAVGARPVNPYLQYMGWDFHTGDAMGARAAIDFHGVRLAYEQTTAGNDRACGVGCETRGQWGSTTMQSLDFGYRMRFAMDPVRPFVEIDLGGVRAVSGSWSKRSSAPAWGGEARVGAGVELPFADRFYASGMAAYQFAITTNPLRDPAAQKIDTALLGYQAGAGDYAQDLHAITLTLGLGVRL